MASIRNQVKWKMSVKKTTGKTAAEVTKVTRVTKSTGPTRKAVVKKLSKQM
jgi:hypothetical protein